MTKKKKRLLIIIAAVAVSIPVMLLLTRLLDRDWSAEMRSAELRSEKQPAVSVIRFAEADWEENVLEDPAYLDKQRYIEYTDGAVSTLLTGDAALYSADLQLFLRFFDALVAGDDAALTGLFTGAYLEETGGIAPFTGQKVYNISVERLEESVLSEGENAGSRRSVYRVGYMIMQNNGTFRDDIGSDASGPQIFELLDDGSGPRVNGVARYSFVY